MNCKQGDMAYVVSSMAGNEGKIVRCLRQVQSPFGPAWVVDPVLFRLDGSPFTGVWDSSLRPIRGDLLDDSETSAQPREVTA